jgi:class 3 adenylate cyclase
MSASAWIAVSPEDSRDLFGATVQRASRLCNAAETDQILVSASVSEECGDGGFTDLGHRALKGFQEPVRVFACDWRGERPN